MNGRISAPTSFHRYRRNRQIAVPRADIYWPESRSNNSPSDKPTFVTRASCQSYPMRPIWLSLTFTDCLRILRPERLDGGNFLKRGILLLPLFPVGRQSLRQQRARSALVFDLRERHNRLR